MFHMSDYEMLDDIQKGLIDSIISELAIQNAIRKANEELPDGVISFKLASKEMVKGKSSGATLDKLLRRNNRDWEKK